MKDRSPPELSEPYLKLDLDTEEGHGNESGKQSTSRDTPLTIGSTTPSPDLSQKKLSTKKEENKGRKERNSMELAPLSPIILEDIELSMTTKRGIHLKTSSLLTLAFLILVTSVGGILGSLWILRLYLPKNLSPVVALPEKQKAETHVPDYERSIQDLQQKIDMLTKANAAQNDQLQEVVTKNQELIDRLEKHLRHRRNRRQENNDTPPEKPPTE